MLHKANPSMAPLQAPAVETMRPHMPPVSQPTIVPQIVPAPPQPRVVEQDWVTQTRTVPHPAPFIAPQGTFNHQRQRQEI